MGGGAEEGEVVASSCEVWVEVRGSPLPSGRETMSLCSRSAQAVRSDSPLRGSPLSHKYDLDNVNTYIHCSSMYSLFKIIFLHSDLSFMEIIWVI